MKYLKTLIMLCFCLLMVHIVSANIFTNYRTTIFGTNVLLSQQYANHFYNLPYPDSLHTPGNEKNIAEWQKQYPEITNLDYFHELVYRSTLSDFRKLVEDLRNGKNPFPNNEFAKLLLQKKDKEALLYLLFAKRCELIVIQVKPWRYEEPKDEKEDANDLMKEAEKLIQTTKSVFLKQRYAFQLVRLSYYHDSPQNTISLFDKLTANSEKNYIYYRTLLHKAFALKKNKQVIEANLLFAEVFHYSVDLRGIAFCNINYAERDEKSKDDSYDYGDVTTDEVWQATLEKATNPLIKNALYLLYLSSRFDSKAIYLKGSFENGANMAQLEAMFLKQLKVVEKDYFIPNLQQESLLDNTNLTYGYDAPPRLPRVVTVEEPRGFFAQIWYSFGEWLINLLREFSSKRKTRYVIPLPVLDTKNLSENNDLVALEQTALKIVESRKDSTEVFFLGVAYLQMMRTKYDLAKDNIKKAKNTVDLKKDTNLSRQIFYLETLLTLLETSTITPEIENMVVKNTKLLWKDSLVNDKWQKTLLFSELGHKYLADKQLSKAALSFYHCKQYKLAGMLLDCYATQADLDDLLVFSKGQADTPIKKMFWYLLPQIGIESNFIKDLQATKLAREGKFVESLSKFKSINPIYWVRDTTSQTYYEESSEITTSFVTILTQTEPQNETFSNKMLFIERLVKLEVAAKNVKGDESAKIYIRMANGMYRTPFWLYSNAIWKHDSMIEAMSGISPLDYPFNINSKVATQFHNQKTHLTLNYCLPYLASVYYQKAFETATSRNLKADALLAQAMSWNNFLANYWDNNIRPDYRPLKMLKNDYADTPQAKQAFKDK